MTEWVLTAAWVPLFRLTYLLLCFAATFIGVRVLRATPAMVRAAVVAGGFQLVLGIFLDGAGVRLGLWRYAVSDGLVLGVAFDLHLAWALAFGVLYAAASPQSTASAWRYGLVWCSAAVTADALGAPRIESVIVRGSGLAWLLGDMILVGVLLIVTLWLYRAVLRANLALPGQGRPATATGAW